jgi:two-component system cell cycle sensor histidine kinase/response regulator CckA
MVKILIVEDEGIVAKDLENTLRTMGYEVVGPVSSGEEAIQRAGEAGPDLVLMDIVLKGAMDGAEAADQIRRRWDIPVIYLTAYADERTLERAKISEPYGYLLKPFQERELKSTIEVALYRHGVGRELQERERWFATTLKSIGEGVITTDPKKQVIFLNPAAETLTGWPQEEAKGKGIQEVLCFEKGREGTPEADKFEKILQGKRESGTVNDALLLTRGGTLIPVEASWTPIRDNLHSIQGMVWVLHDLRGRKQAEQEMRELQGQLHHSQKMEAIGRLAGGIAHDFNNSITIIRVCSQLALMELKEMDPLREKMQLIDEATQRSEALTRQLLAFSRRQVMEMKVLNLNQILRDQEKMLLRIIGEDIEIQMALAEDLGRVKADPGQIDQVVINLTVNARDAMPDGGKLIIETANVDLGDEYSRTHVTVNPGSYVMVSVQDTGTGITPEVQERIFEPFFTTKEKGKGTGLGLSTVYGIVKQSGGHISVSSEPGNGATFRIYLPRVDEPPYEVKGNGTMQELLRGKETVLVVEDDAEVRKLTAEILKRQGYRVLEAANGGEAVLIGERCGQPIHLLVADLLMPTMSGPKLFQRLTPLRPEMKVLFMSGYAHHNVVGQGLEQGFNFVQKPFSVDVLARKVREVLDLEEK